jgi:5-hydroxyisourate hydrolase-like protein (transthyretin family)
MKNPGRFVLLAILSSGLMWGSLALAAEPHDIDISMTGRNIYRYPSTAMPTGGDSDTMRNYPPSTTVTAKVVDQAGKPVAGVPVKFTVASNSMLQGMVQFNPQQATTDADGTVRTTVSPTASATTGAGQIIVQTGNIIETVNLSVDTSFGRARN